MKRFLPVAVFSLVILTSAHSGTPMDSGIHPGPGVTAVKRLGDFLPALTGTAGDSPLYFLESGEPGATVFVAAGTHGNEIAGIMAAVMLVERAIPERGRLIVLPHANNSAGSHADPDSMLPEWISIEAASGGGERRFGYGSRLTSTLDQLEPDPDLFIRSPGETGQAGSEARNLNRAYPGRPDGTLTQKIAFSIMTLLRAEKVDLAFDLHEAGAVSGLAWTVVADPLHAGIAAEALIAMEEKGIDMKLETSGPGYRGLSHYEWSLGTNTGAFLIETLNPWQVPGATGVGQADDSQFPLWRRIGVQLETIREILDARNESVESDRRMRFFGLPDLAELEASGLGVYY